MLSSALEGSCTLRTLWFFSWNSFHCCFPLKGFESCTFLVTVHYLFGRGLAESSYFFKIYLNDFIRLLCLYKLFCRNKLFVSTLRHSSVYRHYDRQQLPTKASMEMASKFNTSVRAASSSGGGAARDDDSQSMLYEYASAHDCLIIGNGTQELVEENFWDFKHGVYVWSMCRDFGRIIFLINSNLWMRNRAFGSGF